MTTAEYLNDLITAKEDMKSAIEENNVEVTGGLTSYADAIRSIEDDIVVGPLPDKTKLQYNSWTVGPELDTSVMTDMSNMFKDCSQLTAVPSYNTSKVTDMSGMLGNCTSLTTVPLFDTNNITDMHNMFYGCSSLTTVPQFDTSNVGGMYQMFYNCYKLTTVPLFDTSNVTDMRYMFYNCISLTTVGGFKDLGKQSSLSGTNDMIYNCDMLTYESAMNIINNLYDRATAGYSVLTLDFHANVLALLSDEEIAIATNKGWAIA